MQRLLKDYLDELKRKQKRRRKAAIAATLAAIMLVSSVLWNLAQYGIAMTGDAKCGIEEHQHSEACYENVLICGQEEHAGHTHTEACYQTETELVCGQEERTGHTHTELCYQDGALICEQEEDPGHTHDESCYTTKQTLICGQEESAGHTHTDACYEKQLTCGKEEHTHSEACYIDKNADVEEASVWDAQYADTKWKDAWGEDLVTAAEVQIGYKESIDNYSVAEDGSHKGYTRYGAFAGDVYADWDAAFVNFCMHYAGLETANLFPMEIETAKWYDTFAAGVNGSYLTAPAEYEPQAGDLVFFQKENEETESQMGIVSSYNKEQNEIKVIEGNSANTVKENKYTIGDKTITAYLKISELEAAYKNGETKASEEEMPEQWEERDIFTTEEADSEKRVMSVEGTDYTVIVSFTEEAGIPENAVLDVKELEKDGEEYLAHYYETMETLRVNELQSARFFDITFLVDGEEIEPTAPVEVSIKCEDIKDADVVHFAKEGTEVLDTVNGETENSISFTQKSFSVTALAERATGDQTYYEKTSISNVSDLDGKSFLIVWQSADSNNVCCFGDSESDDKLNGTAVAIQEGDIINLTNAALWTFEKVGGTKDQYYLKNESGKYLRINSDGDIRLGRSGDNAQLTIEVDSNGRIKISGNSQYIKKNGNNNNFETTGKPSNGDWLTLYSPKAETELTDQFHQVPTVTSDAFQIKMVDYDSATFGGAAWSSGDGVNSGANIKQGILSSTLSTNGYPMFTGQYSGNPGSGTDFGTVFNNGTQTEVNQSLFQLDAQGYYHYDSMENSARLVGNDFIVYEELTSPKNVSAGTQDSIYGVGNFLPYDNFYQMKTSGSGNQHTNKNEQYKDQLYLPDGSANYFFGMELTTNFYQMQNGYNNGNPMIYEFSGDDDMWVYIDGVLVLDLGGCHDRRGGSINFATGEVITQIRANVYETTYLDDIFEAAGVSTADWKTVEGSAHKIFPDYSKHSFKMWYLERGAGASNLKARFNLPVVEPGQVTIEKNLSNTDKEKYANVEFGFQVFLQPWERQDDDGNDIFTDTALNQYRPLCQELKDIGKTNATVYKIKADGTEEELALPQLVDQILHGNGDGFDNNCTTEAVFYLKPGEKLVIRGLKQNRKYYVREVGAVSDEYDKVTVNGAEVDVDGSGSDSIIIGTGSDGQKYIQSADDQVADRPYIAYTNNCSAQNSKELQITKKMAEGQEPANPNDTFTFKVWLEGQDGTLIPYSGEYYITDSSANRTGPLTTTNGEISEIKIGDTVAICNILSGTDFLVKEILTEEQQAAYSIPEISIKDGTYDNPNPPAMTADSEEAIGAIKLGANAEVTVTNSLNMEYIWQIVKRSASVGADGTRLTLSDAKFGLYQETEGAVSETPSYYGKSDNDGIVKWYSDEECNNPLSGNVPAGKYKLEELAAPTGYTRSDEILTIEIGENNKITVTSSKPEGFDDKIVIGTGNDPSKIVETTTVYFENVAVYSLPSTGGPGIYWYIFGGILLMAGAMLIIYKNKCKEVLKS